VRSGILKSVVPTDRATDRYNDMLQERLEDSAWSQCSSWYRVGAQGRIFSTFPGPLVLFWWWLRKVRWEDYEIEGPGAEEWRRRHAVRSHQAWLATVTLFGLGALSVLAYSALQNGGDVSDIINQVVGCLCIGLVVVVLRPAWGCR
jgi:hypothetical protein